MSYNFRPIERDSFLLPPDMKEWLPEGHFAYVLVEVIGSLDFSEFVGRYRADGVGATAFHPQIEAGVILYGYSEGLKSSRQIERRCQEDVACRVVAANQQPDHCTISRFIKGHPEELQGIFIQVLRCAGRWGWGNWACCLWTGRS